MSRMEVLFCILGFLACVLIGVSIIFGRPLVASSITMVALIGYFVYRIKFKGDSLQSIAGLVFICNILVVAPAFFAKLVRDQKT